MQVRHTLARLLALVDNEPIPFGESFLLGNEPSCVQEVLVIALLRHRSDSRYLAPWHDKNVDWRLGIIVSKRETEVVFVDDLGVDFSVQDAGEESHLGVWVGWMGWIVRWIRSERQCLGV